MNRWSLAVAFVATLHAAPAWAGKVSETPPGDLVAVLAEAGDREATLAALTAGYDAAKKPDKPWWQLHRAGCMGLPVRAELGPGGSRHRVRP